MTQMYRKTTVFRHRVFLTGVLNTSVKNTSVKNTREFIAPCSSPGSWIWSYGTTEGRYREPPSGKYSEGKTEG